MSFSLRSNGDRSILVNLQPKDKDKFKIIYGDDTPERGPAGTIGIIGVLLPNDRQRINTQPQDKVLIPAGTAATDIINGDTGLAFADMAALDLWLINTVYTCPIQ
jgi:hypothetical protein